MELWDYDSGDFNSNHLPSKKIKTNEINIYLNNNFGFDRIILLF